MLFILAMEVLGRLFCAARNEGLIRPLETQAIKHHCSIYQDDVILFVHPDVAEARVVKAVLGIFGDALGLKTNLGKCSITPIFAAEEFLPELQKNLGRQLAEFPIRYLGLPLSTKKLPKNCM